MLVQPLRYVLWIVGRVILALRYWYKITGRDEVLRYPGPYLVLPNHPGYVDPPNLFVHLWPRFQFRPLLIESNFENPLLAPFAWLARGIKVPDLDRGVSAEARDRAQGAVTAAVEALKAGENVVIWPSGRLMRDGVERIGGTRSVADILTAVPEVTVVLARTRGLWGSMFSWAYASKPRLINYLFRGAGILLANLIVLAPRRRVSLTLEAFPREKRPEPNRDEINRWLEGWYNSDVPSEVPTYVPYHFAFGKRSGDFPPPVSAARVDASQVKPATKELVAEVLATRLRRPLAPGEDRPETTFMELGLDSLDAMEVTLEIEQRTGYSGDSMPNSIGQLWILAEGLETRAAPKPPPAKWFASPTGPLPLEVLGETVPSAMLERALRHPKDVAMVDDISGVLTYERVLLGALILARRFRDLPEANVGLLMPSSAAGFITLIALHLAGKLPVILNWTTGPANMAHAVNLLGVRKVVTSRKFIDRTHVEVPGAEFVFLEEVRGTVGKLELLRRLVGVRLFPGPVVRSALSRLDPDPHKPAVVLFTSGSEKAPKAVPLTHANAIADIRGALPLLDLDRTARVLVFLPLFHSFGHTITGLLPLLVGARAVYHPDPTDASGLVRKSALYQTTALAATPTFLVHMLDRARPGDLDSLQVIVVGAEKCPPSLFERVSRAAPYGALMEGYGVTECSPCVSVNPRQAIKPGTIGMPLVNIEVCVTDLETGERLPPGRMGMLHVAGPIVFPGYIGHEGPQPFAEFDGQRWYVTGDLAELDNDGYIIFHGRLKRFLKAGGEMISLPALEGPFARLYPPTDEGPKVAIEGIEMVGGRRIVLFTTEEITLKEANDILFREGFRGVMRIDEVRKVDSIPVLGTGKTDYKILRAQIADSTSHPPANS